MNFPFAWFCVFLLVGVVYDRGHHREIQGFGGIGAVTPRKMGIMILATFASMGLPGLIGFTSAIFVYFGLFFQRLYELSSGAVFG